MKALHAILLFSVCLPVLLAGVPRTRRSLWDLRELIECVLPKSYPLIDFGDYGCYCGKGGSGVAVDQLDRCCENHDHCYTAAMNLPACASPLDLDNPYTHGYYYECDHTTKTITCLREWPSLQVLCVCVWGVYTCVAQYLNT
uniref:Phospholipase A2 n=1 Tax=Denticeps clupeoides TaxID=299321 RepID=A0AAY4AYJ5_9TELE